jgi:uncharacterized protein with FMN-binding domain
MDRKAWLVIGGAAVVTGGVFVFTPPQLNPDAGLNSGLAPVPNTDPNANSSTSPTPSNNQAQVSNSSVVTKPSKKKSSTNVVSTNNNNEDEAVITGFEIETEKSEAPAVATSSPTSKSSAPSQSVTPTNSAKPTPVSTPTPVAKPTPVATPTPVVKPTPAPTQPPVVQAINGTFTGDAINVSYGIVQVRITVTNNKITDAQAIQSPTGGKSGSISNSAIPILRQETLAAQSAAIRGVSGASFTSNGWIRSLTTAISRAGI